MAISKELQAFRSAFLNACAFKNDDISLLKKYVIDGLTQFGDTLFDKDDGNYTGSNPQELRKRLNLNFSQEKINRLLEYYHKVATENLSDKPTGYGPEPTTKTNDKTKLIIMGVVIIGFLALLFLL